MKLQNLYEKKQSEKGTYAGVSFDEETLKKITNFIKENKIPNAVPADKLHTTLLYSRKYLPDYKAQGEIDPPYVGTPKEFDVWESQEDNNGEKTKCLVLKYSCKELEKRHEYLMDEHDATYDFDQYRPHITFSYNIGDLDVSELDPSSIGDIVIVKEYQEDLNLNWAKENT